MPSFPTSGIKTLRSCFAFESLGCINELYTFDWITRKTNRTRHYNALHRLFSNRPTSHGKFPQLFCIKQFVTQKKKVLWCQLTRQLQFQQTKQNILHVWNILKIVINYSTNFLPTRSTINLKIILNTSCLQIAF